MAPESSTASTSTSAECTRPAVPRRTRILRPERTPHTDGCRRAALAGPAPSVPYSSATAFKSTTSHLLRLLLISFVCLMTASPSSAMPARSLRTPSQQDSTTAVSAQEDLLIPVMVPSGGDLFDERLFLRSEAASAAAATTHRRHRRSKVLRRMLRSVEREIAEREASSTMPTPTARERRSEKKSYPRICYFSPIQCIFTRDDR